MKQGTSLLKGTVVLLIEPTTFKISLNQSKSGLAGSQPFLAQLMAEEKSKQKALSIVQDKLNFELMELDRIKSMWKKRMIARSSLDTEENNVLTLQQ